VSRCNWHTQSQCDDIDVSSAKRFLSPKEFAESSGLSESTVRRRIKDGTIDSEQPAGFGTRICIPVDALQRSHSDDDLDGASDDSGESEDTGEDTPQTDRISGPRPKWKTENE
jgi:excisionase family DNA binding protein